MGRFKSNVLAQRPWHRPPRDSLDQDGRLSGSLAAFKFAISAGFEKNNIRDSFRKAFARRPILLFQKMRGWLRFWTVILLAGRMAIPQELYEAAEVDGAAGLNRFVHITFPLLANLYLICTLLSTVFTLGDFNAVYFVSGGGPALSTHVLATLGIRNAFEIARPDLGMAAVMSALPLMIPLVVVLMRKLRATEVQL